MNARIAVVLSLLITSTAAAAAETAKDLTLWYAQPAEKWEEALPIGSGRMGAMVFGGVGQERIQFNEDTLWTGKPHDYVREGARAHLETLRKGAFANYADGSNEEKALNKLEGVEATVNFATEQATVGRVRPLVVWARERRGVAVRLGAEHHAAVRAAVDEPMHLARPATRSRRSARRADRHRPPPPRIL